MSIEEKEMKPGLANPGQPGEAETPVQKPTLAEQVIVTIKILAGFAAIGAALWGVDLWVSAG